MRRCRIPGSMKMVTIWLIPKAAEKSVDMRTIQGEELKNETIQDSDR